MNNIKKIFLTIMISLVVSQVWAMDLNSAKGAGLIGEKANGYLGIVSKPASQEATSLLKSINSKRKAKYQEIAKSKGVALKVVEKQAGEKVIGKARAGHYINNGSGWKKK